MNNKGLIDSNIFIYAHDIRSPFYTVTHAFLSDQIQRNGIIITPQILLETYRILTQKIRKPISIKNTLQIIDYYLSYPNVLLVTPTQKSMMITSQLASKYKIVGVHIFDTYLVGTMIEAGITTIYSANIRDFKIYKEIKVINPCQ